MTRSQIASNSSEPLIGSNPSSLIIAPGSLPDENISSNTDFAIVTVIVLRVK